MYSKILIPTDGSELSEKAIEGGVALAKTLGAKLVFVAVNQPLHTINNDPKFVSAMPTDLKAFVHEYLFDNQSAKLNAAQEIANASEVSSEVMEIESEQVYKGIIDAAEARGCDLILMASHGRSGVSAIVLGSETAKVLTHSKIPVLVHRY